MTCADYRRARTPDQKAERTSLLLQAAAALLDEGTPPALVSLADLAARAGMAKSNVYRYFESREAILLAILADDAKAWAEAIVTRLPDLPPASPPDRLSALLHRVTDETLARPRLCVLLSVMPSVLEHNVSDATVLAFKQGMADMQGRLVAAVAHAIPELPPEAHATWLRHATPLVVGGWPLAHPPDAVRRAVVGAGLGHVLHDLERDLRDGLQLIGAGVWERWRGSGARS